MGATSATGVGRGAATTNKGPHNNRDQYVPLITPHIVTAGSVTLAAGTATVTFPTPLTGSKTLYAVVATAASGSTAITITKNNNGASNFASFTITGANVAHDYMVSTVGVH